MQLRDSIQLYTLPLIALMIYFLTSCTAVSEAWAPPVYQGPGGQLTDNMTPVIDEARKFNFLLPEGWEAVNDDEELPANLEVPRNSLTETGMGVWRKGNKGSMLVWCKAIDQPDYGIEQSLYKISPSAEVAMTSTTIKTEGFDPVFYRYDSSMVEKGRKSGFSFFLGTKSQPLTSLYDCNYVVIARSATLEDTLEIQGDFVATLRSLRH